MSAELPRLWTLEELCALDAGATRVWASPRVAARAAARLPFAQLSPDEPFADELETLIVVAGGNLIDRAKARTRDAPRRIRLIAVPSIWGSGAEASPIVVLDRLGEKEIRIDRKYLPDGRAVWPELAASIPPSRAREACGDCWAHALEGFLSPLAQEDLRQELAELIRAMLATTLGNDPRWFELGARACSGQARSSVGLVHGLAHTLEAPLRLAQPEEGWHHAQLCALLLYPVMLWNRKNGTCWDHLVANHGLDEAAMMAVLRELFDARAYQKVLPVMTEHWRGVLRNPCSRTNCALVRPGALDYFQRETFA